MSLTQRFVSGLVSAVMLSAPPTVAAQSTPKVEAFGGYSYLRLAEQPVANFNAENLNGWDSSIKLNATPRLGLRSAGFLCMVASGRFEGI